jgi:hypothetical protein
MPAAWSNLHSLPGSYLYSRFCATTIGLNFVIGIFDPFFCAHFPNWHENHIHRLVLLTT